MSKKCEICERETGLPDWCPLIEGCCANCYMYYVLSPSKKGMETKLKYKKLRERIEQESLKGGNKK